MFVELSIGSPAAYDRAHHPDFFVGEEVSARVPVVGAYHTEFGAYVRERRKGRR